MKVCSKCNQEKDSFNKNKSYCKDCQSKYKKEYYVKNKERIKEKLKNLEIEEKIRRRENKKNYMRKYMNTDSKFSVEEKKEKNRNRRRVYHKNKMESDNLYRLKNAFQKRLLKSIKRGKFTKSSSLNIENILGSSFEDFKMYIESKFESWMSWNNYGLYNGELNYGWDIDHIIPLSSAKSEEDFIKLNYYTNLQPLCSKINRDIKRNIKLF